MNFKEFTYSPLYNIFLITSGAMLFALGSKAIVLPHQFITGGIFGISLLLSYQTEWLSAGIWYFLLNLPLFVLGWILVSRRFFFYSLYAMVITTLGFELIVDLHITLKTNSMVPLPAGSFQAPAAADPALARPGRRPGHHRGDSLPGSTTWASAASSSCSTCCCSPTACRHEHGPRPSPDDSRVHLLDHDRLHPVHLQPAQGGVHHQHAVPGDCPHDHDQAQARRHHHQGRGRLLGQKNATCS